MSVTRPYVCVRVRVHDSRGRVAVTYTGKGLGRYLQSHAAGGLPGPGLTVKFGAQMARV